LRIEVLILDVNATALSQPLSFWETVLHSGATGLRSFCKTREIPKD
jgi:hypothetical protein